MSTKQRKIESLMQLVLWWTMILQINDLCVKKMFFAKCIWCIRLNFEFSQYILNLKPPKKMLNDWKKWKCYCTNNDLLQTNRRSHSYAWATTSDRVKKTNINFSAILDRLRRSIENGVTRAYTVPETNR